MAERAIRASDGDRERVVDELREQTAQGRLTLEEFEQRMEAAYAASTWSELRTLTRDLPVEVAFGYPEGRAGASPGPSPPGRSRLDTLPGRLPGWALPAITIAAVVAVLALVTGNIGAASPLIFFGAFWFLCGRGGCRPRRPRHHGHPGARTHHT